MTCRTYRKPLTPRQGRFCSRACVNAADQPWRRNEVLALLRETSDQWMTLSDLAFWVYGDDTYMGRNNLRMHVHRLKRAGYPIKTRKATWVISMSVQHAYRLIEQAVEVAA